MSNHPTAGNPSQADQMQPKVEPAPLIFSKIAEVMKEVDYIGKGRKNAAQGYNFRGIDDVYNTLHAPFSKAGIFVTNQILKRETAQVPTKSGGLQQHVVLHIRYTLHASDGSSVTTEASGEAMDSGDKAEGKAQSYALKVALMQLFCIPTEEQKDTEYQSHERVLATVGQAVAELPTAQSAMSVWRKYPHLHADETFKAAVKADAERRKAPVEA